MAAQQNHPIINLNLLYPQGIPQKLPIKLLKWVLTFGRYIAIIVEIIVLATFAARFKLDSDLAELNGQINDKVRFIESSAATEQQIRLMQYKLDNIRKTSAIAIGWEDLVTKIASLTPQGVTASVMTFETAKPPLQFKIIGTANTNDDLSLFIRGLKRESKFSNINLASLTYDRGAVTFTIQAQFNK